MCRYHFQLIFSKHLLKIFYGQHPSTCHFYYKHNRDLFYLKSNSLNECNFHEDFKLQGVDMGGQQVLLIPIRKCITSKANYLLIIHISLNQTSVHLIAMDFLGIFEQHIYVHSIHPKYFQSKRCLDLEIRLKVLQYMFALYLIICFNNTDETEEIASEASKSLGKNYINLETSSAYPLNAVLINSFVQGHKYPENG